jgi:hypothetical protein
MSTVAEIKCSFGVGVHVQGDRAQAAAAAAAACSSGELAAAVVARAALPVLAGSWQSLVLAVLAGRLGCCSCCGAAGDMPADVGSATLRALMKMHRQLGPAIQERAPHGYTEILAWPQHAGLRCSPVHTSM